jgi:sugar phosphate isomerase/epimerase
MADTLAGCIPTGYPPVSIQLALAKAFPDYPGAGSFNPGYARRIRNIFNARNIAIAVLGCYINPVHPDPDLRDRQLHSFEEHLRFARDFGCPIVGTETGSRSPDTSYHPETKNAATFDLLCSSLERLIKTAEKCGSIVGIEAVSDQHTISSIEDMRRILDVFSSPALKVIYDPVNLVPSAGLSEAQETFFNRAFDTFGSDIVAVHAKDFRMEGGVKCGVLPAGKGILDYTALLKILCEKKPGIDILLENTIPANVHETMAFLTAKTMEALS